MRDNELTIEILSRLKGMLQLLGIETFIDIIDNRTSKEHQKRLYKWLTDADYLYLIETTKTYYSPWVKKELDFANRLNIPIIKVSLHDIKYFLAHPINMTVKVIFNNAYEYTTIIN
ncbi:hypothetical protein H6C13_07655 [Pseudoflavonifractor phocaeensis]|nr:hypothetical protein [Pseudoflavonifractor phocaeensis]MBM6722971.1 hypothetical protein [Pseudoflavonifractor phocaeensis]